MRIRITGVEWTWLGLELGLSIGELVDVALIMHKTLILMLIYVQ